MGELIYIKMDIGRVRGNSVGSKDTGGDYLTKMIEINVHNGIFLEKVIEEQENITAKEGTGKVFFDM